MCRGGADSVGAQTRGAEEMRSSVSARGVGEGVSGGDSLRVGR